MALFSRTKKKTEAPAAKASVAKVAPQLSSRVSAISSVRVTEKATKESEQNVYTFNVRPDASKTEVMESVKSLYGVTPVGVRIVQIPAKTLFQKGKKGRTASGKKAYVTLKKGDQIEFI